MAWGNRKANRVTFAKGYTAQMIAIDGTWRRQCNLLNISASGARLVIEGSMEGLKLAKFFLLLSSTGLAYRCCELVRVNGDEIGVKFCEEKAPRKPAGTRRAMSR